MRTTLLISFLLAAFCLFAHEGGHGHSSKIWMIDNAPMTAEFVKYEAPNVVLLTADHQLHQFELSTLTPRDQAYVQHKYQQSLVLNRAFEAQNSEVSTTTNALNILLLIGISSLCLFVLLYRKNRNIRLIGGSLVVLSLVAFACNKGDTDDSELPDVPANDVGFLSSVFGSFSGVTTDSDNEWFYIASNGLPDHDMMVGITNWQQQVPIDHSYMGNNSWSIPLQPVLAEAPLSTEDNFLRGAIAVAANGIPIFNPLNNRGEDANVIGELDQWGGHCGRADDYHYHLPPTHLQATVGAGKPIAYALDGFPVYGETTEELDAYLGRFNDDGSYQYHTITSFPYFIAGMRGEVAIDPNTPAPENQITPQARTQGVRPALTPLRDASITNFVKNNNSSYSLTYRLNGADYVINYAWDQNDVYTYEFVNPDGSSTVETYQR
jgi:hypothetical protein